MARTRTATYIYTAKKDGYSPSSLSETFQTLWRQAWVHLILDGRCYVSCMKNFTLSFPQSIARKDLTLTLSHLCRALYKLIGQMS